MVINRNGEQPISVNGKKIKVVEQFKYLGSMIKDDDDSLEVSRHQQRA